MWSNRSTLLTFCVLCIVMINGDPVESMSKTPELPIGAYEPGCICGAVGRHCGSRVATGQLQGTCRDVLYECLEIDMGYEARYIGDCTWCEKKDVGNDQCACMLNGSATGKHCASRYGTYLLGHCRPNGYYNCDFKNGPCYHVKDCPQYACYTDNGVGRD
ncbi:unnamed protein product, partial [Oppiella nova]